MFLLEFQSCKKDCLPVKASSNIVNKNYSLPPYSGIDLSINADVFVTQDSIQSLRVEAPENVIDKVSLSVSEGNLHIGFKTLCGEIGNGKIKVYAKGMHFNSLNVSGSGSIVSNNTLSTSSLKLHISGSGEITTTSQTESLTGNISGSGKMNLSGTTNFDDLKISGSGDVHAYGLNSANATIKISGSGNAEVNVSNSLNADISGSGDVLYKGNPTVNSSISGSGKLKHVD